MYEYVLVHALFQGAETLPQSQAKPLCPFGFTAPWSPPLSVWLTEITDTLILLRTSGPQSSASRWTPTGCALAHLLASRAALTSQCESRRESADTLSRTYSYTVWPLAQVAAGRTQVAQVATGRARSRPVHGLTRTSAHQAGNPGVAALPGPCSALASCRDSRHSTLLIRTGDQLRPAGKWQHYGNASPSILSTCIGITRVHTCYILVVPVASINHIGAMTFVVEALFMSFQMPPDANCSRL